MTETTPGVPESAKPKVAATAIGGNLAVVAVWLWNQWQVVEKCAPLGDVCEMVPTRWNIADEGEIYAFVVANIAWIIGPLLRRYQQWADSGTTQNANMIQLAKDVRTLALEVKALKEKNP